METRIKMKKKEEVMKILISPRLEKMKIPKLEGNTMKKKEMAVD